MLINYADKFKKMREVGKYTTECLDLLQGFIKPGITSKQVDAFVKDYGDRNNLINADFGYHGFPAYSCTSLNEVMCHGIPNDDIIEAGVLKVDVTFIKDGYHGDACRTYVLGNVPKSVRDFVDIAANCTQVGIQQCGPGVHLGLIGKSIEEYAKHVKVFIARDFVGHGIGEQFHCAPGVSHVYEPKDIYYHFVMEPGLTFTVEPIVMQGSNRYRTMKDGWGVRQKERKLTAQFESTIGITFDGYEVFCH